MRNSVRELRKARGLSQEALARAVGVNRKTVLEIEKGRNNPCLESAIRIARLLGKPVEEVFRLEADPAGDAAGGPGVMPGEASPDVPC